MYMLQMMNMCGKTAIMVVLKSGLYSMHEGEKRVQNLDIDILHETNRSSIIYISFSTRIVKYHGKT